MNLKCVICYSLLLARQTFLKLFEVNISMHLVIKVNENKLVFCRHLKFIIALISLLLISIKLLRNQLLTSSECSKKSNKKLNVYSVNTVLNLKNVKWLNVFQF